MAERRGFESIVDQVLAATEPAPEPVDAVLLSRDPGLADGQRILLEMDGYEVRDAADAQSALELIRSRPPDLLFIDALHSEEDGGRVLEAIHAGAAPTPTAVVRIRPPRSSQAGDDEDVHTLDLLEFA
jgi:CheY-like chemotaxis protein